MAESKRTSALTSELPSVNAAVTIVEVRRDSLWQINGAPREDEFDRLLAPLKPNGQAARGRAIHGSSLTLLWNGPGMWFVEGETTEAVESLKQCLSACDATMTDLSHARTILRVSGHEASTVISKGCPVDVDRKKVDDVFSSHLGHLNVMMRRVDAQVFDIYVFRSFGIALLEWLDDAAKEWAA